MAILLKPCYSLNQNGDTLTVLDNTGEYSSTKTGGWGSPNPALNTALVAEIRISLRDTDGNYGDVTTINAFSDLPSEDGGEFEITSEDAGQGTVFPDGIYKITYYVSGLDGATPYIYSVTTYKSFHPAIDCCYQKLAIKVSTCSCNCQDIKDNFNKMSVNMRLLKGAECSGNLDSIQKYIAFLTDTCRNCGCGCVD